MTQARRKQEEGKSISPDPARDSSAEHLEEVNRAFRKLMGLLARPVGGDLFQRGIEAVSMVLRAGYGGVVLCAEGGQLKESVFTRLIPWGKRDVRRFIEQRRPLVEAVIAQNAALNVAHVDAYLRQAGTPIRYPTLESFLGVPIADEERVYGCVYLCDKSSGEEFGEDDVAVVASFAQTLGFVLSQARGRAERQRAQRERELLARLGLSLSAADTLEKLASTLRDITETFWQWDAMLLSVRRSGRACFRSILKVDTVQGQKRPFLRGEFVLESQVGSELLKGDSVLINRCEASPGPELDTFGNVECLSKSLIFAPVRVEADTLGILSVQSYKPGFFGEQDRQLLQGIAEAVGPALARCQAEKKSAIFAALGQRLSCASTPEQAGEIIVEAADELIGWDACSLTLYSPGQKLIHVLLNKDIINGERATVAPFYMAHPPDEIMRRTIEQGPQLFLRGSCQDKALDELHRFGDLERLSQSLMFVPFRSTGPVVGVLSIQSYTPNVYDERDLATLQALADHCAGALERTRVERALREKLSGLQLLRLFYENSLEPWNRQALMRCLHELCPKYLAVDRVSIMLYDEQLNALVSDQLLGEPLAPKQDIVAACQPVGFSISGKCFAIERVIVIGDCSKTDLIPVRYVEELGLKSTVAVPIRGRKKVIGVMRVDDVEQLYRFSDEDVELLTMLAEQIGVLLENARLFQQPKPRRTKTRLVQPVREKA